MSVFDRIEPHEVTVFHLSHNDLDGYGAQHVTGHVFPRIHYFNVGDYRRVVDAFREMVSASFEMADNSRILYLITDIGFSLDDARAVDRVMRSRPSGCMSATLIARDHHGTSHEAAKHFAWCHVDTTQCSTLDTFRWLAQWMPSAVHPPLMVFADIVDAIGKLSLRARDSIDVSALAKMYFHGGGHPNAAGGHIKSPEPLRSAAQAASLLAGCMGGFVSELIKQ